MQIRRLYFTLLLAALPWLLIWAVVTNDEHEATRRQAERDRDPNYQATQTAEPLRLATLQAGVQATRTAVALLTPERKWPGHAIVTEDRVGVSSLSPEHGVIAYLRRGARIRPLAIEKDSTIVALPDGRIGMIPVGTWADGESPSWGTPTPGPTPTPFYLRTPTRTP